MSEVREAVRRVRSGLGRRRRDFQWMWALRGVPVPVLLFQWRARRLALRRQEQFSFLSATRPPDLKLLLELAQGCKHVVELGTGTGWSAISLALADPDRRVVTYDPVDRAPQAYFELVGRDVRERIEFVVAPGSSGPRAATGVDLLYIDSAHEREPTLAEWEAWTPYLRPGALVLFDDYIHSEFEGVRQAVEELGLDGELHGKVFVHRYAPRRVVPYLDPGV